MGIVAFCHYSVVTGDMFYRYIFYYVFANVFYFICVKTVTLLFNKHFAYKTETFSDLYSFSCEHLVSVR